MVRFEITTPTVRFHSSITGLLPTIVGRYGWMVHNYLGALVPHGNYDGLDLTEPQLQQSDCSLVSNYLVVRRERSELRV